MQPQIPTNTDAGADRWLINDDVVRLRQWSTDRCHILPTIGGTEWIIGSGAACWLRLEDGGGRVSRKHACLSRKGSKWVLRDAGSKNGIVVDGTRRDEVVLEPGLEIWLGGITLVAESGRLIALRSFLCRLLGWGGDRTLSIDLAMRALRNAATRQTALVLCAEEDAVPLAHAIHRRALGADRPFIVCDPRRKQTDASVRLTENYRSGMDALRAAKSGSLCIWNSKLPRDFEKVKIAVQDPDTRVQLIVCARTASEAEAFGTILIAIPPLRERAGEITRVVEEYGWDAAAALGLPRTSFPQSDRDWVVEHDAASFADIEKATLRLLAIRESGGNLNRAAARLGMARWSLAKWVDRRKLPIRIVDGE